MPPAVTFDHLAVGVRSWKEGFPRFARDLGGTWSHGGDAGQFAPCQLLYRHGFAVELIAPGSTADGFMHRFISRSGPGPHHLTFKVPSLEAILSDISALGITVLGGRTNMPYWKEAFLHPKQCGIGTLLQVAQTDDAVMKRIRMPAPDGFPADQEQPRGVAWVGLTVESLDRASKLFTGVLQGSVAERGDGWQRLTWGPGRDLLVRAAPAAPGAAALWSGSGTPGHQAPRNGAPGHGAPGSLGVAHVMFGPVSLTVTQVQSGDVHTRPMPFDAATAVPVWLADR